MFRNFNRSVSKFVTTKETKTLITKKQIDAASLFWTQLLIGERNLVKPDHMSQILKDINLKQLAIDNPQWPLTFMSKLMMLLDSNKQKDLFLSVDYKPNDLLYEAAIASNIPITYMFPIKTTMYFDGPSNLILENENLKNTLKYSAEEILKEKTIISDNTFRAIDTLFNESVLHTPRARR